MATEKSAAKPAAKRSDGMESAPGKAVRITSIDALRGLIMFTMIYVNDIAGASTQVVPWWMRHFPGNQSGMTFVDLVFPGFLFIVGMSIPFALGSRLSKGEPLVKILWHILSRTLGLLGIGILMVNETPDTKAMGWSGALWGTLMYLGAILAFCDLAPGGTPKEGKPDDRKWRIVSRILRLAGLALLVWLAFAFRGAKGERIITLSPFALRTEWYGILGLIGWAYLVGSVIFLCFRTNRTALLGCVALLFCLYPADRTGTFDHFWLSRFVGIGGTLGAHPAITTAGVLLASILVTQETSGTAARVRFALLFVGGCATAAWLLQGLYGIIKNSATPAWCLWACAITGALWLGFYLLADVLPMGWAARPLALAGQNVLLAYLLHNLLYPTMDLLNLGNFYGHLAGPTLANAVARSAGCAVILLAIAVGLNRLGFRLKL